MKGVDVAQYLSSRRIARSLVTVLLLTLIQSVVAPIVAPLLTTPRSHAVSGSITASSSTSRSYLIIPAGVDSITLTITGGGGGLGGNDGNSGGKGGVAGRIVVAFAVTPGDVVALFPGNAGTNGQSGAGANTGGTGNYGAVAGGASTVSGSYYNINGAPYYLPNFSGGASGKVGSTGTSGSGGGGGAASVVAINRSIVAIAAGAGGGGGAGNATGAGGTDGVSSYSANSNLMSGGSGKDSSSGQSCPSSTTDGGSGGGGGGGWYGGAGGNSDLVSTECSGRGGYRGNNFVDASISSTISTYDTSQTPASPLNGTITYSYDVKSPTSCVPTTQTVDIYTVVKIDTTGNCTWTVPSTVSVVDIFAVGAGGGGGADGGGGGGGGAALSRSAIPVTPSSSLTINIGVGGNGSLFGGRIAGSGDSSTVTTSTGAFFYALGGSAGGDRTASSGAGGTAPNNGAYAGGAGGIYAVSGSTIGGVGNYGTSNYFYGSQNTYGGGGGGGIYYDSYSNVTGPAGRNGGGAGASNTSANGQTDGVNGTSGTGGGGGAAGAGNAGRTMGGKGGSGVVLIRYATNAADSFPASIASSIAGRWTPNELQVLDSNRKGWVDSSGTYSPGVITGSPSLTTTGTTDGVNSTGSTKTLISAAGDTGSKVTFVSANIPSYTIFHIVRYVTGGTQRRIITASNNWLSGHYNSGRYKAAYHVNDWMTPQVSADYKWLLSTDQLKLYRANGRDVSYNIDTTNIINSTTGPTGFGINAFAAEESNWQFLDTVAFNRVLTSGEIRAMEIYLARIYGLTLAAESQPSETDTALTLDGTPYAYTQYGYGEKLNDTFTVESWVKPTSACGSSGSSRCAIFSRETTLLTSIATGTFWYALYGTNSLWEWIDTGVKAPPNEWHHYAFVKRGVANTADSLDLYIDGQWVWTKAGNPYRAGTATYSAADVVYDLNNNWSAVGIRFNTTDRMIGQIDEVKIWKVARTAAQILADMNSNDASSAQLQFYLDFNRPASASSFNIPNLAMSGPSRSDFIIGGSPIFSDVKVTSITGPYTTITFPRTYITQNGGWKVSSTIPMATTVIAGGGGGAGKSVSSSSAPGGAGGGGGVAMIATQGYSAAAIIPITVGQGGVGATASANDASSRNGQSSYIGISGGVTVLGGGGGASNGYAGAGGSTVASGGGGGGNPTASCSANSASGVPTGTPNYGGTVTSGYNGSYGLWGWGGGGGGAAGAAAVPDCGNQAASPGSGFVDPITTTEYGRGGYSNNYSIWSTIAGTGTANNGWGGGVSYGSGTGINTNGNGFNGSAGAVVIRYITASKPSFTYPSNVTLDLGQTETFTTLVAADSATVGLTRTFRWESTTAGSGGTYSRLKSGTGASNAAYGWVPSDTSTSGSQYLYRVVVTDSDTVGLFIQDTSTAVYATINPAMQVASTAASNTISKTINVARSETFTITLGTSTYTPVLSPVISGISLDTSVAGRAVLKISDTATVGTYSETLTVTDSVSATYVIPLTIRIQAPPSLTSGGEIVKNGQVLNLDAGNSNGILLADGTVATSVVWNDISGSKFNATTSSALYNSTTCNPPTYATDNGGVLNFSGAGTTCYQTPYLGTQFTKSYAIEAWVKLTSPMTSPMQIISQAYSVQYDNIAMAIGGLDQGVPGAIYVGFFDGYGWRLAPNAYTPTLNTWFHIVGTYDGASINTYINGSLFSSVAYTGGATVQNTKGFYIGKRWDASGSAYHFSGSIGEVRAYNRALSSTEVSQNYNATNFRYTASYAQNILKPSQKYGVLSLESFTVTSGGDTKTVALAIGNRTGINWDTSTAGVIKLSVQESLTPGTYYDTVTVTDNYSVTTTLPLKFSITKADTITVYIDTPTALSYTGNKANISPVTKTLGLVGIETGTSLSATYNFKPGGTTCANGGYCRVGDIGPGGGVVFIDTSTAGGDGRYYEAAPSNWTGTDDLASTALFCSDTNSNFYFSMTTIGWGETLTAGAVSSCGGASAIGQVAAYRGGGYSNWYLPNRGEAQQMINNKDLIGLLKIGANWPTGNYGYWTVNDSATVSQMYAMRSDGASWAIGYGSRTDSTHFMVRPIRAFTSCWLANGCLSLATTETPTAVGVYNIVPLAVPNSVDLLTKYAAITYATTNLTINRISQTRQSIPIININYPDTMTVNVMYGSGNGAVTYSTTNGTATGCAFDYKKLYTTTQGTCNITVAKAGDRNYLPDTATASILFLLWVLNQPTNQIGSGATIGLNGATSLTIDTTTAPSVTSLSTTLLSLGSGGTFTITGTGFNSGGLTVKFWRNKYVTPSGSTATTITFNVSDIGSAGASTGRIAVTTVNGEAISVDTLTITP